mmetsp:Transcript_2284/g.7671  ORF Transcript_2284/g.7671 Transcript_2284/m.7671 type:complete len:879 (-) Transcript_2284:2223-4859(-)
MFPEQQGEAHGGAARPDGDHEDGVARPSSVPSGGAPDRELRGDDPEVASVAAVEALAAKEGDEVGRDAREDDVEEEERRVGKRRRDVTAAALGVELASATLQEPVRPRREGRHEGGSDGHEDQLVKVAPLEEAPERPDVEEEEAEDAEHVRELRKDRREAHVEEDRVRRRGDLHRGDDDLEFRQHRLAKPLLPPSPVVVLDFVALVDGLRDPLRDAEVRARAQGALQGGFLQPHPRRLPAPPLPVAVPSVEREADEAGDQADQAEIPRSDQHLARARAAHASIPSDVEVVVLVARATERADVPVVASLRIRGRAAAAARPIQRTGVHLEGVLRRSPPASLHFQRLQFGAVVVALHAGAVVLHVADVLTARTAVDALRPVLDEAAVEVVGPVERIPEVRSNAGVTILGTLPPCGRRRRASDAGRFASARIEGAHRAGHTLLASAERKGPRRTRPRLGRRLGIDVAPGIRGATLRRLRLRLELPSGAGHAGIGRADRRSSRGARRLKGRRVSDVEPRLGDRADDGPSIRGEGSRGARHARPRRGLIREAARRTVDAVARVVVEPPPPRLLPRIFEVLPNRALGARVAADVLEAIQSELEEFPSRTRLAARRAVRQPVLLPAAIIAVRRRTELIILVDGQPVPVDAVVAVLDSVRRPPPWPAREAPMNEVHAGTRQIHHVVRDERVPKRCRAVVVDLVQKQNAIRIEVEGLRKFQVQQGGVGCSGGLATKSVSLIAERRVVQLDDARGSLKRDAPRRERQVRFVGRIDRGQGARRFEESDAPLHRRVVQSERRSFRRKRGRVRHGGDASLDAAVGVERRIVRGETARLHQVRHAAQSPSRVPLKARVLSAKHAILGDPGHSSPLSVRAILVEDGGRRSEDA